MTAQGSKPAVGMTEGAIVIKGTIDFNEVIPPASVALAEATLDIVRRVVVAGSIVLGIVERIWPLAERLESD